MSLRPRKNRAATISGSAKKSQDGFAQASLTYPFTAIVGQEEMKLALLLSVIDPNVGGVVIMGHRGTGKSTAVRALAQLLPPITRVRNCLYGCDPVSKTDLCNDCRERSKRGSLPTEKGPVPLVDLPLGATEDRVCGTLDIERALVEGVKAFEPGLLARANRGFLYIDEVNLLEDHLVDLLLDSAASGRNVVEREGISVSHPARFVLVGSGNPEEGELRPQLLDRFGLLTQITTINDLDQRVEIVERRERFDRDPIKFQRKFDASEKALRVQLTKARSRHQRVTITRATMLRVAELCAVLKIDGHRGELTIARAARALAAFEGRPNVTVEEVRRVAGMSLRHRLRRDPLERIESGVRVEQALDEVFAAGKQTSAAVK
jgi:magnesium chelatase subunit I